MRREPVDGAPIHPRRGGGGLGNVIRRFGWGLGDQLLSSFTNFMLGALIARAVSPRDFGAFSLAYATYTLSLGATRAVVSEPLVVRFSSVAEAVWRDGLRMAGGTAMTAGVAIGVGCIIAGSVIGGLLGTVLTILGIALPALLVQDTWRYAFFAAGRGSAAFVNDAVWTIVLFSAFAGLAAVGSATVNWLTAAWAAGGCVAACVGLLQSRALPAGPRSVVRWLSRQRDLVPRFAAEFALSSGASNLIIFGVGAIAGLGAVGQLRAGQIALGPLNVLFVGSAMATVPEGVRLLQQSTEHLAHASRWISLVLGASAFLWGVVLFVLPTELGEIALGSNWHGAREIVVPLSIGAIAYGLAFGAKTGLRALAAAKRSLRARMIDVSAAVFFVLAGAAFAGVWGAAWGSAMAACVGIPNAWWQFTRALHEYRDSAEPGTATSSLTDQGL
jgi:O-antigen/teichoic acid export membrane protein